MEGAFIRASTRDVVAFSTSINRFEILKSKKIIETHFEGLILDLQWKAEFETEEDWERDEFPKGELWYISRIEDMFEKNTEYLTQNRMKKAKRQRHEILKKSKEFMHAQLIRRIQNRKKMIVEPVFGNITYEIDPNQIFLIMPFGETWSDNTHQIVNSAANESGMNIIRADEIFSPGSIIEDIWKLICKSGLIIADITVHNPNVFYELGLAHAIGKRVLLIKKEGGEKSPFDIGFWRYFEYDVGFNQAIEFKEKLKSIFNKYMEEAV